MDYRIGATPLDMEETIDIRELQLPSSGGQRSITPLSQESTDSCHNNEAVEKGQIDVIVKRVESTKIVDEDSVMPQYKMTAYPRGLALIIEIEEYENKIEPKRIGSQFDVDNLSKLFQQLHFSTEHKQNLSRKECFSVLKEFSADARHANADMMILVILSHGRDGQIIASDGLPVDTERIYSQFNNTNCPMLRGKPKFFIVQACRGDDTDKVFPPSHEDEPKNRKRRIGTDYDTVPLLAHPVGELNMARPTWEDMIIAYSTIPGFTSQRDHHSGTWFIQVPIKVIV